MCVSRICGLWPDAKIENAVNPVAIDATSVAPNLLIEIPDCKKEPIDSSPIHGCDPVVIAT